MSKIIRPFEAHTGGVGSEAYPFLSSYIDNIFADEITATKFIGDLEGNASGLTEECKEALIDEILSRLEESE